MVSLLWPIIINTTNASWKKPNMLQVKSKIHCGLRFLIVVPTNLLRLDAPGWTEECKEHSLFFFFAVKEPRNLAFSIFF